MIGSQKYTQKIETIDAKKEEKNAIFQFKFLLIFFVICTFFAFAANRSAKNHIISMNNTDFVAFVETQLNAHVQEMNKNEYETGYDLGYTFHKAGTKEKIFDLEIYYDNLQVEKRQDQLENTNQYIENIDSSKAYKNLLVSIDSPYYMNNSIAKKNVLLIFNQSISSELKDNIQKIIFQLLEQHTIYVPSKYLSYEIPLLEQKDIQKYVNDYVVDMDKKISFSLLQDGSIEKKLESEITPFQNIKSVEKYYQRWNHYVELINTGKFRTSQEYQDLYTQYKSSVYERGNYVVGKDMLEGYYIAINNQKDASLYVDNDYYNWEQDVIVYLKKGQQVQVNDGVKLHALENSPALMTQDITSGVFKVGQHLAAGNYQITAGKIYPCDYWIVDNNEFIDFMTSFKRKYHHKKYMQIMHKQSNQVTLKKGQFLFVVNGKIEKTR